MQNSQPQTFVGLDIGTSTVRCVVGLLDANSTSPMPSIIGHGSAPNIGMRKGTVVHVDDVAQSISQAIQEAERISGMRIQAATVNVNGAHISGINSRGVIAISSANREITPDDRMRVEEAATIVQLPPNREILQVFAKNYRVDGQDNIKDPTGMRGVRLEVDTHIVTATTPNLRSLDMALERAEVAASHHTVASLAAVEAVLSRQQKESGTLLLDIGAGTTNLVVVEDGEVQHVAALPLGGINITNDLAIGLKTDLHIAEGIKVQHAALGSKQKHGMVTFMHEGQKHFFEADGDYGINNIVEARVEVLFEMVEKELKKIQKARKLPGGVVLVGGTAKIPGLADFAKEKLQLAARIGKLQPVTGLADTVQDLSYVSTIGLMLLDALLTSHSADYGPYEQSEPGLLDGLNNLFKRFKK